VLFIVNSNGVVSVPSEIIIQWFQGGWEF
jgi:hypothetical protein